ncbi:hypothetical protein PF005_g22020 [Phytophthora fragariae]|uniref:Uncharacterized protein n=1 Tax=Phytophthora fragariae TaxID=53985 RepID=A0A6A3QYB8_9STRA|nr:hypothetical protein PF009_g4147 [Phytophthora fragariae]KAE8957625.1 hypothetical protein PF011_g31075 [Phytophthora fragariae]KAE9053540.1 hypothetical protein PF006_g33526 [Phytophthora fragariae]KAE9086082.1 hypothetical protein PF007_g20907 [Phytophthora fragariae]KAE9175982.1 hypothetical protein PF004_g26229 [Phytophthora fragariae]
MAAILHYAFFKPGTLIEGSYAYGEVAMDAEGDVVPVRRVASGLWKDDDPLEGTAP